MQIPLKSTRRLLALSLLACATSTPVGASISDDFESYAVGSFPSPTWLDVATVLPTAQNPVPSAFVIKTLNAQGSATQALSTIGDIASSKGIYAPVPLSSLYHLQADVRVDRYSDAPDSTVSDWAMQLTFAQTGVANFANTPQAGIYASSLTQGWRLFLISSNNGPSADIDLSTAANVGQWYHLDLTLDTVSGAFHSVISDAATLALLADQVNVINGWQPQNGLFDSFAFFGGDLSQKDTIGNIGVVDNVNISVPEPATALLLTPGLAMLVGFARRQRDRA